jgi:hypothetical protein
MIRINLLPEEYRRSERTSPKIFAATLVGVILVCSGFGWFGFVYFGELGKLEAEHAAVAEQLVRVTETATYYDRLEVQRKDYEDRVKTIQDIGKSRRLWTKFVEQVLDIVNNDGNTERHMGWFNSIEVKNGRAKVGPSVAMPGAVQGEELRRVGNLHEDMENAPFFVDIAAKVDPSGLVDKDDDRQPPEKIKFTLKMTFKPPNSWVKNRGN